MGEWPILKKDKFVGYLNVGFKLGHWIVNYLRVKDSNTIVNRQKDSNTIVKTQIPS
jgi:hypothetical protein